MTLKTLLAAGALLLLALLATGCDGDTESSTAEATEPAGASSNASSTPAVAASTPLPTQAGPARVRTSLSGSCRITAEGAEIRVEIAADALGSTTLTRIRLLQDGQEAYDSGPLDQRSFRRINTYTVNPGDRRTYRLVVEAPGANPGSSQSTVACGNVPTRTPGPRA